MLFFASSTCNLSSVCTTILLTEGEIASELTEKDIRAERRIRSSGQVAANIKEQLEPVLDLLVENTKWATVEMLERYYSALQCCIHQHRHSGDKTRLIRVCEGMPYSISCGLLDACNETEQSFSMARWCC